MTESTGVKVDNDGVRRQDRVYEHREEAEYHNIHDYNCDDDSDNDNCNDNQRSLLNGGERDREIGEEGKEQAETIVYEVASPHSLVHRDKVVRKNLPSFPSSSSSSSSSSPAVSQSHSPVQSVSTLSSPSCRSNSILSVGVDMIDIGTGPMKNRGRVLMVRGGGRKGSSEGYDNDDDNDDDNHDEKNRYGHGHRRGHGPGTSSHHSNLNTDIHYENDRSRTTSAARVSQIQSPHMYLYLSSLRM